MVYRPLLGLAATWILTLAAISSARASGTIVPPPAIPPKGGFVIFGDNWDPAVNWRTIAGDSTNVSLDRLSSIFGSTSLRVISDIRKRMELVISINGLLDKAEARRDMGLIELSKNGVLQFWLKSNGSIGSLEMWFKSFGIVDGQDVEMWNSKFVSSQLYVTPTVQYQEVLIPLIDFGPEQMDWFHLVRDLHIRFPSSEQGGQYYLDEIRILYNYDQERLKDQEKRRKRILKAKAEQDPYLWLFRDSKRTEIELLPVVLSDDGGWAGADPLRGHLMAYFQAEGLDSIQEKLYYQRDMNSFVIVDEEDPFEGLDSINIHGDQSEGFRVSIPFTEVDLTPILRRGCLHFAVKGAYGGELFDVEFRSRSRDGHSYTFGLKIEYMLEEITTQWQHVKVELIDFGTPSGNISFDWARINAVSFVGKPAYRMDPSFWIDAVWFGSCRDAAIPQ